MTKTWDVDVTFHVDAETQQEAWDKVQQAVYGFQVRDEYPDDMWPGFISEPEEIIGEHEWLNKEVT